MRNGLTVEIADHTDLAKGVEVTVTGSGTSRAEITIKGLLYKLRPGTYGLTDPPPDVTTVQVITGEATAEYTPPGATSPLLVVVVGAGETACLTLTRNDGGDLLSIKVEALVGTIDVNGNAVAQGQQSIVQVTVPVAILSTAQFNAVTQVDRASPKFGRSGSEARLASCKKGGEDVNGDGRADLTCYFTVTGAGTPPWPLFCAWDPTAASAGSTPDTALRNSPANPGRYSRCGLRRGRST